MIDSHDIEIQVRPRSGLALKHGISVVNSPGTVDSGYRDEIGVIIINHGALPFTINTGDRIAQLVICKLPTVSVVSLDNAPPRVDRVGGFGHTGVK
jgi:dUTP pyrophosphatase